MEMGDINFLIIGATKSATTWLQQSLQLDPRVHMPDPEIHYFSRYHDRGDGWYLENFKPTSEGLVIGEKSNSYLDTPAAAARIHQSLPHVLLVAQLRNPVERAYSDYCMLHRRGEATGDIERYLDPRQGAGGRFLEGGLYFRQLRRFLEFFPRERLLVLFYEDLKRDAAGQVQDLRQFLGLDGNPAFEPVAQRVKDKTKPLVDARLRQILKPLKPIVAPLRDTKGFEFLRSMISAEFKYVPLNKELTSRMIGYYEDETDRLAGLLGRDLGDWLKAPMEDVKRPSV
ncbi:MULTISPECIES: sulfotransferase [Ensifer]|uniref:sulfotransferase family protein n=1 Tax=Ensifer TaxID=106591 RepID=UPI00070D1A29|nr:MULTISPECIES: sulfotransferase [Ensifer]KQU88540.1 heparan sulfate glucosamine 3-O-sulfotransferase [Ensifer sp. Root31]KQW56674.1 heparan sulfate glucosamine 3-O-sulfotransferase [Ensifer sp. Root1252]KQW77918.1 heparan sulfate glucosamine 3-O-sulfotransferase [Ensifer sp. Root127]KRC75053.1 heparan sulfate glucosamine 3-O-sulfotransferase [Ensifer sp. Root231]KRC96521.1 heparan sulfate glucosamine 3-O-sulfotransferase [Ensifer sp. Root258]